MRWFATDNLIEATVIKSFLPLQRHPELNSDGQAKYKYHDVYIGSKVFISEWTEDKKWCRGYLYSSPRPIDYIYSLINASEIRLNDMESRIVTIPYKYVYIIKKDNQNDNNNNNDNDNPVNQPVWANDFNFNSNNQSTSSLLQAFNIPGFNISSPPSFLSPEWLFCRKVDSLQRDIHIFLNMLCSYIYIVYANQDYILFTQLTEYFDEISTLYYKLYYRLYLKNERFQIIETINQLVAKVSKIISSKSDPTRRSTDVVENNKKNSMTITIDPCGYDTIFPKLYLNSDSLETDGSNLQKFVNEYLMCAFSVSHHSSLIPSQMKNNKLTGDIPLASDVIIHDYLTTNILMNFQNIVSDLTNDTQKLDKFIITVSLMTENKTLITEPLQIPFKSLKDLSVFSPNSTVLFKDLLKSIVYYNKVFLVISLKEEIKISFKNNITASSFKPPFILIEDTTVVNKLHKFNRGIAIGVIDISSIFKRKKPSTSALSQRNCNKIHKFTVNLYTCISKDHIEKFNHGIHKNILENSNSTHSMEGWGSIITNILTNSMDGLILNSRAKTINISLREIESIDKNYLIYKNINLSENYGNPMVSNRVIEKLYLKLGKVSLFGVADHTTNIKNIVIKILPMNDNINFIKGSNPEGLDNWISISVSPEESINEIITIANLLPSMKSESLRILAYINGYLMAHGSLPIIEDGKIMESLLGKQVPLFSSQNDRIIDLFVYVSYYGSHFNVPSIIRDFNKLLSISNTVNKDVNIIEFKEKTEKVLAAVGTLNSSRFNNYFEDMLIKYLQSFEVIEHLDLLETQLPEKMVLSLISFLRLTMHDPNSGYKERFFMFFGRHLKLRDSLPQVGYLILKEINNLLENRILLQRNQINDICEEFLFLLMFSFISADCKTEWYKILDNTIIQISKFIKDSDRGFWNSQNSLLQTYHTWICGGDIDIDEDRILRYTEIICESFIKSELLQGINERNLNEKEIKYLDTKFLILQTVIRHEKLRNRFFEQLDIDPIAFYFLTNTLQWTLKSLHIFMKNPKFYHTFSLCNTVIVYIIENVQDPKLMKHLLRLLPSICEIYLEVSKHHKENNHNKVRHTFTILFPVTLEQEQRPVDLELKDRVILSEILLEIASILCKLSQIAITLYGNYVTFETILKDCELEMRDDSTFYISELNREYVVIIIETVESLMQCDFFPKNNLLGLTTLMIKCCVELLMLCKDFILENHFKNNLTKVSKEHDKKLLIIYFKCLFKISNHKVTSLLNLGMLPSKLICDLRGDIKQQIFFLLKTFWNISVEKEFVVNPGNHFDLFEKRCKLIIDTPSLLKEIIISSFQNDITMSKIYCKFLFYLIVSHWKCTGNLEQLLNKCVMEMYNAYKEGEFYFGDKSLNNYIKCVILTVNISEKDLYFHDTIKFFQEFFIFLEHISGLNKLSNSVEYNDERILCKLELFNLLMDINHPEHFEKLINDLFMDFVKRQDFVQAALILELFANTYSWCPYYYHPAIKYPPLPKQSSFERKEYLYKEAGRNFSRGLNFEKALSVYTKLINAYNEINYDMDGLAFVHDQISHIYTQMQNTDKLIPRFFKVDFFGNGFPSVLRNKVFIYEGLPFEHISSIQSRLLKMHPYSQIVNPQNEDEMLMLKKKMDKFINVVTVEPVRNSIEESNNILEITANMPRLYNGLKEFKYSKRLPGSNDVIDLWVEEYIYTTTDEFPTLFYKSVVENIVKRRISPIENAIKDIETKIQELTSLKYSCYKTIKNNEESTLSLFQEFSRSITGTISAPVNGGFSKYKKFLIEPTCNLYDQDKIEKLASLLDRLTILLSHCLLLNERLQIINEIQDDNHKILVELYQESFSDEIKRNDINLGNMIIEDIMEDEMHKYRGCTTSLHNQARQRTFKFFNTYE